MCLAAERAVRDHPLVNVINMMRIPSGIIRDNKSTSSRSRKLRRVAIDKSEGAVKDKNILGSAVAPLALPERLRTKALEISR